MLQLRDYQRAAVCAVRDFWAKKQNGLVSVPTGGGKSLIQAFLIKAAHKKNPDSVFICLCHVKELIEQNYNELKTIWPDAPAGIVCAGLGKFQTYRKIIFTTIQTFYGRVDQFRDKNVRFVLIDEAHLIPQSDSSRYRSVLQKLNRDNENLRTLGLTATPYRLDNGVLYGKEKSYFSDLVYEVDVLNLIKNGYLAPVTSTRGKSEINTAGVKIVAGDFNKKEIEDRALEVTAQAIAEMIRLARNRKKWLIFACGIKHAELITEILQSQGIAGAILTGKTNKHERAQMIRDYKNDNLKVLVNVNVLTTGFNVANIDMISMMRPTQSTSLYVQMIGRGMRTAPNKENCLVLDFSGNIARHGPVDNPVIAEPKTKKERDGERIKKEPVDKWRDQIRAKISLNPQVSDAAILSTEIDDRAWLRVKSTKMNVHRKPGRPNSVCVRYTTFDGIIIREWASPENPKAARFYTQFCRTLGLTAPYPATAAEFVAACKEWQAQKIDAKRDAEWTWRVENRA